MDNNTSRTGEIVAVIFIVGLCIFLMYLSDKSYDSGNIKAANFYMATVFGTFLTLIMSIFSFSKVETKTTSEKPISLYPLSFDEALKGLVNVKPPSNNKAQSQFDHHCGWVYLLHAIHDPTLYKIGRSSNPDNRLKTFNVKLPFPVEYEHLIKTDDMFQLERELHVRFSNVRQDGEWFKLSESDTEYIKSIKSILEFTRIK